MKLKISICAIVSCVCCGCGTPQIIDGSCSVFKPISNSTRDTEKTRREVVAHNKVYGAICK